MARIIRKEGPGKRILEDAVRDLKGKTSKVGWLESAKYPDKKATPVAYVAAIQEFGSPAQGIPPRLGMRATMQARRNAWRAMARRGASAVMKGDADGLQILSLVAEQARGDFLRTIRAVTDPPLKPGTIAARVRKKASGKLTKTLQKPLVDTGLLIATMVAVTE